MTAEMTAAQEIESFFEGWQGEIQPMRDWFRLFYQELSAMDGVTLTFVARPGVSYSIRPVHESQTKREAKVYSEILPYCIDLGKIQQDPPKGIILSGGPASVYEEQAPVCDKKIFELGIPILGICYGAQLIAQFSGG